MPLYITYPSWIQPSIFPGVPVLQFIRWYGLMYVFAFTTAYYVFRRQVKEGALNIPDYTCTDDDVYSFFTAGILLLIIGARIFSCLVYDSTGYYLSHPWLMFWPWDQYGNYTGLAGMSYHGGVIGGFLGMVLWCWKHKKPVFKWMDVMGVSIPLGYTFGRLGNFFNGELFGRITTKPWGMVFPSATQFSISIPWVKEFAEACGMEVTGRMVNLPRHPSQLYEAFFEGIVLFLILWLLRKKKPFDGFISGMYFIGYGTFRFFIEYFRQPDEDLGYRIEKVKDATIYTNASLLNLSTGQILCLLMILAGLAIILIQGLKSRKQHS